MSITFYLTLFSILFALSGLGAVWDLTKTDDDDENGGSE